MSKASHRADVFIGDDLVYLQTFQDGLARTKEPADIDAALKGLIPLLEPGEEQVLQDEIAWFRTKLNNGYLTRAVPVGKPDANQDTPWIKVDELRTYKHDYALVIYVYTLETPGVYKVVQWVAAAINQRRQSSVITPNLRKVLPFMKLLQTALEQLPDPFKYTSGVVIRAQSASFQTAFGRQISASERFPVDREFYRYGFQSATKFDYSRMTDDFLDTANTDDPGAVFEIEVTRESPAYDIEAFSAFTIQGASEGEVLFNLLSYWKVHSPTVRHSRKIAGVSCNPEVIQVKSIAAPCCPFCEYKIHMDEPELHYGKTGCSKSLLAVVELQKAIETKNISKIRQLYAVDLDAMSQTGQTALTVVLEMGDGLLAARMLMNGMSTQPLQQLITENDDLKKSHNAMAQELKVSLQKISQLSQLDEEKNALARWSPDCQIRHSDHDEVVAVFEESYIRELYKTVVESNSHWMPRTWHIICWLANGTMVSLDGPSRDLQMEIPRGSNDDVTEEEDSSDEDVPSHDFHFVQITFVHFGRLVQGWVRKRHVHTTSSRIANFGLGTTEIGVALQAMKATQPLSDHAGRVVIQDKEERTWQTLAQDPRLSLDALLAEVDGQDAWMRLLDARFLIELAKQGGTLKTRQAMPKDAYMSYEAIKQLPRAGHEFGLRIVAFSRCWLQKDDPDPRGFYLQVMAGFLEMLLKRIGGTCAVFSDFSSVFQPRSRIKDSHLLGRATYLGGQEEFMGCGRHDGCGFAYVFGHPEVLVAKLDMLPDDYPYPDSLSRSSLPNHANYFDRGWCFLESAISNATKPRYVFELSNMTSRETNLLELWQACKCRDAPLLPEAFNEQFFNKRFSSLISEENPDGKYNGAGDGGVDYLDEQAEIYKEVLLHVLSQAKELNYSELDWGDDAAIMMGRVIAAGLCRTCEVLDLSSNCIGILGIQAVLRAITGGGLQACKRLDISNNAVGASYHTQITDCIEAARTSKALPEMVRFRM